MITPEFLLVRGTDLLVVGVRWERFTLDPGGAQHGRLVAEAGGARLTLVLPPQSIAEEKFSALGQTGRRGARISGPSQVTFEVEAGTEIALDATSILRALTTDATGIVLEDEGSATAIEMPWHLTISPAARGGGRAVSSHAAAPVLSPDGAAGLWHMRLRAPGAGVLDAGLELIPVASDHEDAGLDVRPLAGGQRQSIRDSLPTRPRAGRLDLSALGGSLSATLTTDNFDWDHVSDLGRDHRVQVVERGVLYPFGHRAVYIETAERIFDPDGSPTVAGLHRQQVLIVTEPVRRLEDGDLRLVRQFPFSEVEILTRSFPDIEPARFEPITREARPHGSIGEQLDALVADHAQRRDELNRQLSELPADVDTFIQLDFGSSADLKAAQAEAASFDPEGLQQAQRDIDARIDQLEESLRPGTGPDGEPIPVDQGTIDAVRAEIQGLLAERPSNQAIQAAIVGLAQATQRVNALRMTVQQEFDNLPRTIEAAAAQGSEEARAILDLAGTIETLRRLIADIAAKSEFPHDHFFFPRAGGRPLGFPVRCAGGQGDATMSIPLMFVRDFRLPEEEFFDPFHSLTTQRAVDNLTAAWQDSSRVELPGTRIDLVRSGGAVPAPGDVHEVHAMTLVATPHGGGFRPQTPQLEVDLPALRELLPDRGGRRAVTFAESFLDRPGIPEMPLLLPGKVDVDFRTAADRAGGLVSPKFIVDGISRTLGPVAAGALPPALAAGLPAELPSFDLEAAYRDATLLGFPLHALIDVPADVASAPLEQVPMPPAIVQLFEGGVPNGMKMEWTLPLKEHGPFRPSESTQLHVTVTHTRDTRETTCTVNDFDLVLPPQGLQGLLTLTFGSVEFTQREGQPPVLDIKRMRVGFGGALQLLQELQLELQKVLDLPDAGPKVDVRPTGLQASYTLSAPSVKAGTFLIRNIAMRAAVDVPFDGKPVTVSLSFATRANPFNVTVLTFGGGGYIDLTLGPGGLTRLEASIEFGAAIEVDFVVARGEVHALGGVRFIQRGGTIDIDGFLNIGGSVDVLGLVSVSINLMITLSYRGGNRLVGRATIVVEIDVTLFSDSVEIDSGEWVLAGSETVPGDRRDGGVLPAAEEEPEPLERWKRYREAFAPS